MAKEDLLDVGMWRPIKEASEITGLGYHTIYFHAGLKLKDGSPRAGNLETRRVAGSLLFNVESLYKLAANMGWETKPRPNLPRKVINLRNWIGVQQAAALVGMSRQTIYYYIGSSVKGGNQRTDIKTMRVGRGLLVDKVSLLKTAKYRGWII